MPDLDPDLDPNPTEDQQGGTPTNPAADPPEPDPEPTEDEDPQTSNGKPWQMSKDGKTNLGFPADTAAADMSAEEQVAWWKHQSRKWEGVAKKAKTPEEVAEMERELSELKSKTQSADEKALNEAIEQARNEGIEAAKNEFYPVLHDTQIRGYAAPYFASEEDQDALNTWVDGLAVEKFVDPESKMIDGAKLISFLEASGRSKSASEDPTPRGSTPLFPRTGQGTKPRKPKVDYAEQGRQEAARRKTAPVGYNLN